MRSETLQGAWSESDEQWNDESEWKAFPENMKWSWGGQQNVMSLNNDFT